MSKIPLKNSCLVTMSNILYHPSARHRRNHDMVKYGVHTVPTLRNRVVIFTILFLSYKSYDNISNKTSKIYNSLFFCYWLPTSSFGWDPTWHLDSCVYKSLLGVTGRQSQCKITSLEDYLHGRLPQNILIYNMTRFKCVIWLDSSL